MSKRSSQRSDAEGNQVVAASRGDQPQTFVVNRGSNNKGPNMRLGFFKVHGADGRPIRDPARR